MKNLWTNPNEKKKKHTHTHTPRVSSTPRKYLLFRIKWYNLMGLQENQNS